LSELVPAESFSDPLLLLLKIKRLTLKWLLEIKLNQLSIWT